MTMKLYVCGKEAYVGMPVTDIDNGDSYFLAGWCCPDMYHDGCVYVADEYPAFYLSLMCVSAAFIYGEWRDSADYCGKAPCLEEKSALTLFPRAPAEGFSDLDVPGLMDVRTEDLNKLYSIICSAVEAFQKKYPKEEYEYPPFLADFENRAAQMITDCLLEPGDTDLEDMLIGMHDLITLDVVRSIKKKYFPTGLKGKFYLKIREE